MAIPFLTNIDLNKNELQNAVVQNLGTAPSSPAEGQIYYDSTGGDKSIYFYNGSGWISVGGDITRVNITAGNGLSGTSVDTTSGEHTQTLTIGAGTGITVASDSVAVTPAQTGITSVVNTSLEIGRDADNRIKFGTDNQIIFEVDGGDNVIFKTSGEIEATKFDGALEGNADTATLASTVTVTESSTADTNFNVVYHDGSNALLDEAAGGGFYYNPSTEMLTVKNLNVTVKTTQKEVELINTSSGVIFEGDTADGNETTLDVIDPTADRSILLPNASGTVALTSDFSGTNTGDEVPGSTTVAGVVELADSEETQRGTDTARVVTPDGLASRSVVATILQASVDSGRLRAEITHNLDTEDVIVQCYDMVTEKTVVASVDRLTKAGAASTDVVTIRFGAVPTNNIRVLITSVEGATSVTPDYSA